MQKNNLFENYISYCHSDRMDFTNEKLRKEFDIYDRNFLELLSQDKQSKILEIGFGTGYFLKYLSERGYKNVMGIEQSQEEYDYVKKNISKNVQLITKTNQFLRKQRDSFDYIVMIQVLEHVPKKDTILILKDIRNALKSNGRFICSVPNGTNPFNCYVYNADFTHEFIYSKESLYQVLKIAGFNEVDIKALKEETISWPSKISNVFAPLIYIVLKFLIKLNNSYISKSNIYTRDIIAVCNK